MKVNSSQFSDKELPEYGKAQKTPKEIVIPLSGDEEPQKVSENFKVNFDENGYPIPDGDTLTISEKGLFTKKAEYIYKADGKESIREIKAKFNLKDGAIRKCNYYIVDVDWVPEKGRQIYFMRDDINTGK